MYRINNIFKKTIYLIDINIYKFIEYFQVHYYIYNYYYYTYNFIYCINIIFKKTIKYMFIF